MDTIDPSSLVGAQFTATDKQIVKERSRFIKFWMINYKCCLATLATLGITVTVLGTYLLSKVFSCEEPYSLVGLESYLKRLDYFVSQDSFAPWLGNITSIIKLGQENARRQI